MKKKLLSLLVLCCMSIATWAQDMTYVLVISQKDGTITTFTLDQNPVIKFVGDDIQIYTDESYSIMRKMMSLLSKMLKRTRRE